MLVIDSIQAEATKIYDAFLSSLTLPDMYQGASVQLVIAELSRTLELYSDNMAELEVLMIQMYIQYLQTALLSEEKNEQPTEQDE